MKFTTKSIYSIRAIFDLVHHSDGKPVPLALISKRQKISLPFLAQIFQKLRKGGIVKSIRGPKGGFIIARNSKDIFIGEILRAVEGPHYGFGHSSISEGSSRKDELDRCISNLLWRKLGDQILDLFDHTSIADLVEETKCPDICVFIPPMKRKRKRHS